MEEYTVEVAYISDNEDDNDDKDDDHWNDLENKEFFPISNLLGFNGYRLRCVIKVCLRQLFE